MSITSWTTEGPLKVLTTCRRCIRIEVVLPDPRVKKIPEPFTPAMWAAFLEKGRIRAEQISA